ncbi:WD40-repeat-containing domain protein, partial [Ochromonadaceae sp. CCMP2298]
DLVIGMRNLPHLTYIALTSTSLKTHTVSLNTHQWDTHVTFAPLYLAPSPGGDLLAVATDSNIILVLKTGTNERVQVLSGHASGEFGKPVISWDHTGDLLYSTSENSNEIFVFDVISGKCWVVKVRGHSGIVRTVCCHRSRPLLLSGSYDKSILLW